MEYGHIIKESITAISLRILALHQIVCFYSHVLLKRVQSKKQNVKKKKYHSFKPLGQRNMMFVSQENACEFLFLRNLASRSEYKGLRLIFASTIFSRCLSLSRRYSW